LEYKCNIHKSNEGFNLSEGKWICWYCFKEKIDVGDIVVAISKNVVEGFRNKLFVIIRIVNENSENQLYMVRFEDFKKFINREFDNVTEIHGTEDLVEKIGTWG